MIANYDKAVKVDANANNLASIPERLVYSPAPRLLLGASKPFQIFPIPGFVLTRRGAAQSLLRYFGRAMMQWCRRTRRPQPARNDLKYTGKGATGAGTSFPSIGSGSTNRLISLVEQRFGLMPFRRGGDLRILSKILRTDVCFNSKGMRCKSLD